MVSLNADLTTMVNNGSEKATDGLVVICGARK